MNRLQSNNLNIIVNIQYGIGFEFIDGKVEVETTILNKTQKSRAIYASRNRINFYEEFMWEIDKTTLKYCRTINEIAKFECFTTPELCFGNINRRQRIGHIIIKLKEFQLIGRDWDQCISVKGYKLQGSNSHYELQIVLIIQEELDLENDKIFKKNTGFNSNQSNLNEKHQSLEDNKQGPIKITKKTMSQAKREYINKSQKVKNDLQLQENYVKNEDILNNFNFNNNKNQKSMKRDIHNELNAEKKKIDLSIKDSKESLFTNEYNECKLKKMLAVCYDHTDLCMKMIKAVIKYLDVKNPNTYSSNSSIQSEIDSEQVIITMKAIKKKLKELTEYITCVNEKIKHNKIKYSREISTLKNANYTLSKLCDTVTKKISND